MMDSFSFPRPSNLSLCLFASLLCLFSSLSQLQFKQKGKTLHAHRQIRHVLFQTLEMKINKIDILEIYLKSQESKKIFQFLGHTKMQYRFGLSLLQSQRQLNSQTEKQRPRETDKERQRQREALNYCIECKPKQVHMLSAIQCNTVQLFQSNSFLLKNNYKKNIHSLRKTSS